MRHTRRTAVLLAAVLTAFGTLISPVSAGRTAEPTGATKAYFAGGCFWCMEEAFEKVDGVTATISGFMGGTVKDPSYEEVSSGRTGHAESVEVQYDPSKVSYNQLLEAFWRNIDPVTANAQFCDHGSQYRAAIFYRNEEEKQAAEDSKRAIEQSKRFKEPIVTQIAQATEFYPAEEYHQDFYRKNPIRYKFYKSTCGRARRLEALWGPAS